MKNWFLLLFLAFSLFTTGQTGSPTDLIPNLGGDEDIFYGSEHFALGDAEITWAGPDSLRVDSIGSSGDDGMRVDFSDGDYHIDLAPQDYASGDEINYRFYGNMITSVPLPGGAIIPQDDIPAPEPLPSEVGTMSIKAVNSNLVTVLPDFSASGSSTYEVTVFDSTGALVHHVTGLSNPMQFSRPSGSDPVTEAMAARVCMHANDKGLPSISFTPRRKKKKPRPLLMSPPPGGSGGTFTFPGGASGYTLLFNSESGKQIRSWSTAIITAKNIDSFVVDGEWLIKFDDNVSFKALDNTRFFAEENRVRITPLSSSGIYGHEYEFLPFLNGTVTDFYADIEIPLSGLEITSDISIQHSARFSQSGSEVVSNELIVFGTLNALQLSPSFASSSTYNYKIFYNREELTFVTGQSGPLSASFVDIPDILGVPYRISHSETSVSITFPIAVELRLSDGDVQLVDRIEFVDPTTPSYDHIIWVKDEIWAGISELHVTHAATEADPYHTTTDLVGDAVPFFAVQVNPNPFSTNGAVKVSSQQVGSVSLRFIHITGNSANVVLDVAAGPINAQGIKVINFDPGTWSDGIYHCEVCINGECVIVPTIKL